MDLVGGPATCPHRGPIMHLGLDHLDQEFLLACSGDGVIGVYRESQEESVCLEVLCSLNKDWPGNHTQAIHSVDWYPIDNGIFVSGSQDRTVKVWDSNALECVLSLDMEGSVHGTAMSSVATSHNLVAITGNMRAVTLGDIASGSATHILSGHSKPVWSCAWSSTSEWELVSAGTDGQIRLWDIRRPGALHVFDMNDTMRYSSSVPQEQPPSSDQSQAHTAPVTGCGYVPGGLFFMSTGNDGKARLWDVRSRKHLLKHYQKRVSRTRIVRQMSFSEDGRFVFHPSENVVYVFDIVSGRLVNILEGGHYAQVHCCAWNAKREHLYTAGADKNLLVWGMETRFLDADMLDKDEWSDEYT